MIKSGENAMKYLNPPNRGEDVDILFKWRLYNA